MKLTSHEEYGFRCLLRIGKQGAGGNLTISEISAAEGISVPYVGKLLRILRQAGFITSVRGKAGGYTLARPASKIVIGDVLEALGGRLFQEDFCKSHSGEVRICTHSVDCSIRSVWRTVQVALDQVLGNITLQDLLRSEQEMTVWVHTLAALKPSAATTTTPVA